MDEIAQRLDNIEYQIGAINRLEDSDLSTLLSYVSRHSESAATSGADLKQAIQRIEHKIDLIGLLASLAASIAASTWAGDLASAEYGRAIGGLVFVVILGGSYWYLRKAFRA